VAHHMSEISQWLREMLVRTECHAVHLIEVGLMRRDVNVFKMIHSE
jgi:hypothetical protein